MSRSARIEGMGQFFTCLMRDMSALVGGEILSEDAKKVVISLQDTVANINFTAKPKMSTILKKLIEDKAFGALSPEDKEMILQNVAEIYTQAFKIGFNEAPNEDYQSVIEKLTSQAGDFLWSEVESNALKKAAHNLENSEDSGLSEEQASVLKEWGGKLKSISNPQSQNDILYPLAAIIENKGLDADSSQVLFEACKALVKETLAPISHVTGGEVKTTEVNQALPSFP